RDGAAPDVGALERNAVARAIAFDDEFDARAERALERLARLADGPPGHRLPLDLDEPVADLDAGALGRRARPRLRHHDPAIARVDRHADAAVGVRRDALEALEAIRREVRRVRVAELVEHAARREFPKVLL